MEIPNDSGQVGLLANYPTSGKTSSPWKDWESFHRFAALFIFFWLIVVVVHHLLCRKFQWYHQQVLSGGIQLSFGRLYITFHHLHRPIQRLGSWTRLIRLWRIWFICGVLVSSLLILPSILFLLYLLTTHLLQIISTSSSSTLIASTVTPNFIPSSTTLPQPTAQVQGTMRLMPVIPGVNLPVSNMLPFFISILISTLFHELGHGISAASELTEIGGVGVAVIGVFPAAFVVIRNLDAQALSRQLRIMAAGVWHNIILAALTAILLWNLPMFLGIFFHSGRSVTITEVYTSQADMAHANHTAAFHPGMEIYSINNCSVTSSKSLERCSMAHAYGKAGFCLSVENMKTARGHFMPPVQYQYRHAENGSVSVFDCCQRENSSAWSSLCFHAQAHTASNLTTATTECLQVEKVRNSARCNASSECLGVLGEECYIPYLLPNERLLIFNTSSGPLLLIGPPLSVLGALKVSHFSSRTYHWLVVRVSPPLWLAGMVELCLKYLLSVSAALALLNVVPCVGLDGQHMLAIWTELLLRHSYLPAMLKPYQTRLLNLITVLCTLLLVADVFLAFLLM